MFEWRFMIEAQPRSKNGQPAHSTTGVAHTRPIQFVTRRSSRPPRPIPRHHVAHREEKDRQAQRRRSPQPPRHVHELGVRRLVGVDRARLERHPADRARPRRVTHDLGMHRTRVFDPRRPAASRAQARAPCHTSGRRLDDPARPRDPLGRRTASRPAPRGPWLDVGQERFRVSLESLEARRMAEVVPVALVVPGYLLRRPRRSSCRRRGPALWIRSLFQV